MRFFVTAAEVMKAARTLETQDPIPGGWIFDVEPIEDPKPDQLSHPWRCLYHGNINCFVCQYQNVPVKR